MDVGHHIQRAGGVFLQDGEINRLTAIDQGVPVVHVGRVGNGCHVAYIHVGAQLQGNFPHLLNIFHQRVRGHQGHLVPDVQVPGGYHHIAAHQRLHHILRVQVVAAQLVRVHIHQDRPGVRPEWRGADGAWNILLHQRTDVVVGQVAHLA